MTRRRRVSLSLLVLIWGVLVITVPHHCTAAMETTVPAVTLRVDVQNMPRAALEAGESGQMIVRLPSANLTLEHLSNTLRERLQRILGAVQPTFSLEVYDAKMDRYQPLDGVHQLGRRSRLNVLLQRTDTTASESCPALPARMFGVDTERGGFRINGHAVRIGEVANSGLGTGLTTWDGSVVLAKYLEHKFKAGDLEDKKVLEVGAGTGLVGLSAALMGAREVVLTDLEYTMENLKRNIQLTMEEANTVSGRVTAEVLDWFKPRNDLGGVHLILASDVVWVEELIPPLVETLYTLVKTSSTPPSILMSHQQRSVVSDALLFHELEKRGFVRREIPPEELHPDFVSDRIHVWEITLP